jgi:predicted AAA+ superfamily ATPase
MFTRSLALPAAGRESFFLWGPRQAGKSTLLRSAYGDARWFDLLKADAFRRYLTRPEALREELEAEPPGPRQQIAIDEIQKVPALLDEVHWLIESRGLHFAFCGSSARKLRCGGANLLGGRATRYELHGLTAYELGRAFALDRMLNHGYLPRIYESERPRRLLDAYVADYLKREVAAEGLVRNLPAFSDFLDVAGLSDGEIVNFSNVARECGVSSHTTRSHFQILEDTLLGRWLPAYRRRPKRRVIGAPKFYFVDVGVVNRLAKRGELQAGSELYGKAFENWVFHELSADVAYQEVDATLSYWRLASGVEVDFVLGDMQLALEAKSSERITSDHPGLGRRVVVCREPRPRRLTPGKRRRQDGSRRVRPCSCTAGSSGSSRRRPTSTSRAQPLPRPSSPAGVPEASRGAPATPPAPPAAACSRRTRRKAPALDMVACSTARARIASAV